MFYNHHNLNIIYEREMISYVNNRNEIAFMVVNQGQWIDWIIIMFNHMKKKLPNEKLNKHKCWMV
jgi:hypothetical protein